MHMPSRVFDIFQKLFELTQDTPPPYEHKNTPDASNVIHQQWKIHFSMKIHKIHEPRFHFRIQKHRIQNHLEFTRKTFLIFFSLPLFLNIIDFFENLVLRNKIDVSGICDVGVVISGICVVFSEIDIRADFKAQFLYKIWVWSK